jgi:hypothetical protein
MSTITSELSTTTELAVILPLNYAKTIASFGVFASAKDMTQALQQVKVVFDATGITVLATDRYTAAKAYYAYDGDGTEGTIYLDPTAVKYIAGIKAKAGLVEFKLADGRLTITDYTTSYTGGMFTGNYPSIERMIDEHKSGPINKVSLKIELLTKLSKVVNTNGNKAEIWEFTPGEAIGSKPGPLLATQAGVAVLIQPNLIKP